jgi:lantibiotic biosynthesis protein
LTAAPWRPLLEGAAAEAALAAVDEIAAAVAPPMLAGDAGADLTEGAAGAALLFAALERAGRGGPGGRALLAHAVKQVRREPLPPFLWGGTAGLAFALVQVARRAPRPEVVTRLADWVRGGAGGEYELVLGAIGIGVLGLELAPDPRGAELLEAVVEQLAATAEECDGGLTWVSARAKELGLGPHNLGVAHGVPGVAGFLAGALGSGVAPAATEELLRGAARWVLAQRRPGDGSALPYAAGGAPARLAWCYGDAAAVTLLLAARALGDDEIEAGARELAARAAARGPETAGVVDGGFCHGAAGLGHLFGRLWQLTGDEVFATAGHFWLQRTLQLRRPGLGVGGFVAMVTPDEGGRPEPLAVPGLLTGATGVALALLAACGAEDPRWDHALLASHPFL